MNTSQNPSIGQYDLFLYNWFAFLLSKTIREYELDINSFIDMITLSSFSMTLNVMFIFYHFTQKCSIEFVFK